MRTPNDDIEGSLPSQKEAIDELCDYFDKHFTEEEASNLKVFSTEIGIMALSMLMRLSIMNNLKTPRLKLAATDAFAKIIAAAAARGRERLKESNISAAPEI